MSFTLPPQLMFTTRTPFLLEEVDVGLRVARVLLRELAARARIGQQVPVEFDAGDQRAAHTDCRRPRCRRRACRACSCRRGRAPRRRLVLVGLERRQQLLHLARLGAVDVRLQVGEALEARLQLRHAGSCSASGIGRKLAVGGFGVVVERDQRGLAGRVATVAAGEERGVDAAVPHRDVHGRVVARRPAASRRARPRCPACRPCARRDTPCTWRPASGLSGSTQHERVARARRASARGRTTATPVLSTVGCSTSLT